MNIFNLGTLYGSMLGETACFVEQVKLDEVTVSTGLRIYKPMKILGVTVYVGS